jgi:cardiolipin synthase
MLLATCHSYILDATIAEALAAAALAGTKVHVMLTARASGDPVPGWASNTYVQDVVAAGVRVFFDEKGYLHTKTISIDSEICSIGSANIDIRSFSINYEINAVLYSKQLAMELEKDFEGDLAHCTEFDPAEYLARKSAGQVQGFSSATAVAIVIRGPILAPPSAKIQSSSFVHGVGRTSSCLFD